MIGIVIVTHSHLGDALIEAAEFILGDKPEAVAAVSIDLKINAEILRKKISDGIKSVNLSKQGVVIMTDMFGGTPSNLSYSFLEEGRIEVISGVNLPILIKAVNSREKMGLVKLAESLESYGKRSISRGSAILKGDKRSD
jgi:mannose PTS system EIIA component